MQKSVNYGEIEGLQSVHRWNLSSKNAVGSRKTTAFCLENAARSIHACVYVFVMRKEGSKWKNNVRHANFQLIKKDSVSDKRIIYCATLYIELPSYGALLTTIEQIHFCFWFFSFLHNINAMKNEVKTMITIPILSMNILRCSSFSQLVFQSGLVVQFAAVKWMQALNVMRNQFIHLHLTNNLQWTQIDCLAPNLFAFNTFHDSHRVVDTVRTPSAMGTFRA